MPTEVVKVVHLDELQESRAVHLDVRGWPILLIKISGTPHALVDTCPHNGARLSDGLVRDGCVTCPAHLWRFSLTTGRKQGDDQVAVRVIPTRLTADNWVEIEVPEPAAPRSLRDTLLAHARGDDIA